MHAAKLTLIEHSMHAQKQARCVEPICFGFHPTQYIPPFAPLFHADWVGQTGQAGQAGQTWQPRQAGQTEQADKARKLARMYV